MNKNRVLAKVVYRELLGFGLLFSLLCLIVFTFIGPPAILFYSIVKTVTWIGIVLYFIVFRNQYSMVFRNAGYPLRKVIPVAVGADLIFLFISTFILYQFHA